MMTLVFIFIWALKNWCFWTVVLEKTLESPLDCKEIQPVHPTGNQSWIFIGRTDAEADTPILWSPDANWLIGKNPDAGQDWRQEERGTTEDEMIGWYHQPDEFDQASVVGDEQGSLAIHGVIKSQTWLSDWTEVAITKYHRLVWLNITDICFSQSGGWKLRSRCQYSWVLVRAFFCTADCYVVVSSHGRMDWERSLSSIHDGSILMT